METKIELIKRTLLLILFSMMITMIMAQRGNDNQNPNKPPRGPDPEVGIPVPAPPPPLPEVPDIHRPRHLDAIPDLTREQKDKIKKADLKHLSSMTPLRNQRREKAARLATILSTNPFNLKEAESIADEIGQIDASILKQQIRHDQEIRSLLTSDQQIVFDVLPKPFLRGTNRIPGSLNK